MIVKRIGNDVYLTWEINKKDGSPEDFSNVLDMKVYIRRSFLNKLYEQKFEATGNVIKLHYIAAEQAGIGSYDLCAKWTKPDPMVEGGIASFVVDYRNAFKLIGFDETVPDQQDETFVSQIYEAIKGDKGDTGIGIPTGGTTGQQLVKKSNVDYDVEWNTSAGGGGTGGTGDMLKSEYDSNDNGIVDNAEKVNGFTVDTNVPANAKFTDTIYDDTTIKADIALKADKVDTYTKIEVDNLIENVEVDLTNYYNKSEVDTKLNTKVDNDRVLTDVPANAKFTDTTYSEISEAEINEGASSTLRTITARRITFILGKVSTLISNAISALTKNDVGLGNVDDTSDADKPVSTAVQNALNNKVDKVSDKGLSKNDFTDTLKNKLDNVESGAQKNVNADWNSSSGDSEIKNKPTLGTLAGKSVVDIADINATGTPSGSTTLHGDGTWKASGAGSANWGSIGGDMSSQTDLANALAGKVDSDDVKTNVPAGAVFTDTVTSINGNTGVITKADIVALGIPAQDTVYTHPTGTNPHGTTKSDVGLSNVDNVQQASKTNFDNHTADSDIHITSGERSTWNAKGTSNLTLGETSSTAYRGDMGKTAYDHSQVAHAPSNAQKNSDITKAEIEAKLTGAITSHTHSDYVPTSRTVAGKALTGNITLVKGDVGLGNVDNTSDANKPVSTAQQTALNAKIDASKFQVVASLPASPVAGVFYFVKE